MTDFNPSDLRNVVEQLLLFDFKGFKIFDWINMAFKRGIDIINDPMIVAIISCLQMSNY